MSGFLYFLCITNFCFATTVLGASIRLDRVSDIDNFIEKLLQSNKFDELANKIAEIAIDKIKDFKSISGNTKKLISDPKYRGLEVNNNQGEMNIKSLIKAGTSPLGNLSLKYKNLIKMKPTDGLIAHEYTNVNNIGEEKTNAKKVTDKAKIITSEGSKKRKKNKKREKVVERSQRSETDSSEENRKKNQSENSHLDQKLDENKIVKETTLNAVEINNTIEKIKTPHNKNKTSYEINKDTSQHSDSESASKAQQNADSPNELKDKTKLGLHKDNDRLYVLESSSEYEEFKDKIYEIA